MATIQDYLDQIASAVYGKEVRSAIYNAILQCYKDGSAVSDAVSDLIIDKVESSVTELIEEMISDGTIANLTVEDASITEEKIADEAVTPDKTNFINGGKIKLDKIRNDTSSVTRVLVKVTAGQTLYWSGTVVNAAGTTISYAPSSITVYEDSDGATALNKYTFTYPYPTEQLIEYTGYAGFEGILLSNLTDDQIETYFDDVVISTMPIDDTLDDDQTWKLWLPEDGWQYFARQLMPASFDLCGKTWMQIGDSLTALESGSGGTGENTKGFGQVIAQKYGCTFINNGTFGATWAIRDDDEYDSYCGVTRVQEVIAMDEPPEYLTIALGTNDRTNGTEDDTVEDTDTLYGAVRYCLSELKSNIPHLRLGVILEPQRASGNADLAERNEIIKAVCKEYAVPTCDMYYESGIVPDMLSDGLHLTSDIVYEEMPTCRWLYMKKLESFLLSL